MEVCQGAGIQVVMITGDRKETAIAIAREVNLLPATKSLEEEASDKHLPRNSVLTSDDLHALGDNELAAILPEVRVIARALPSDKSRLVRVRLALLSFSSSSWCARLTRAVLQVGQQLNLVVGMTGDGVNDAAALNRADVGFAMGSGTEMAKGAPLLCPCACSCPPPLTPML